MSKGNEAAFPVGMAVGPSGDVYTSHDGAGCGGLTKREYFAAMAMQGMVGVFMAAKSRPEQAAKAPERLAGWSVACADALLVALNEKEEA